MFGSNVHAASACKRVTLFSLSRVRWGSQVQCWLKKTLLILEKVFQLMVYLDRLRSSLHLADPFIFSLRGGKLLCRPAFSLLLGVAVTPNAQRVWAKNRNCVISTFWFSLCTFYTTSKSVIGLELLWILLLYPYHLLMRVRYNIVHFYSGFNNGVWVQANSTVL